MAKYKLLLPKMGESVEEATIIKWTKKPGDYIEADETVMEIATDKVDSDVPSPVSGTLVEQLCKDNDVVKVGATIAIIETGEAEVANAPTASETPQQQEEHLTPPVSAENLKPTAEQTPPQVPAEPYKTPVQSPQPVANTPWSNPAPKQQDETKPVFAEPVSVPYVEQITQRSDDKTTETNKSEGRFYSPLVKNIAAQEGISNAELDKIPGTGAEGRLTKDDLLAYVQHRPKQSANGQVAMPAAEQAPKNEPAYQGSKQPPVTETSMPQPAYEAPKQEAAKAEVSPAPAKEEPKSVSLSGGDEIVEMDRMRRLIADHMVMSKQTSPHVTSFVEADVTNLVLWRDKIKSGFEKREGQKITFTPIFIEAVARAIKDYPMINIQVNGTQIIKKKDINISMATALPSGNLIVPVIKKADELNLLGLTKAVNDLASRARENKLKPDDVQGGTFTLTNVGSFGNVMGTPIINQPQVAILAVGAIRKKPAVIETLQGDMIGIRHMMFLSLSYDHRVVDGALGGSFVRRVADYLENWETDREI
ncbi:dihydrolipoamide acetyltransferase family protein [Mucilaginibacter sp. L3T2-6]|uniref:dihydrolipoamide acetyltransferase family protein n=1 Tax=Mucilaginibacter sp. L3T2-6 TaxID=3062491 RepID=UPI002675988E|nr:dihydrolipoamide acetyltransferase family protein [Mucilaginibacter sp. L3T2-6]MDO3643115.1 dihydrolipoamide acetyltransferase family protein [Mucilaginibacter sp. L3T2-6]MDV6215882.1 dihydrolipoamide acetyltransferase family protein [Mucilaginibacter sp. L3T2-6]